jgi:hypothetical protein
LARERLLQVGDQVLCGLDAGRVAHDGVSHANRLALLAAQLEVAHQRRLLYQRLDAAKTRGDARNAQRVDEARSGVEIAL